MKTTIYETVTNSIIAKLEEGTVPWRKPWAGGDTLPCNAITQRPYRGVNVLLLSLSPYADHRWLTFKQVSERGGRIKAGQRSTMVVFWKRWDQAKKDDADNGDQESRPPVLRYFNVFNVDQCEGLGMPSIHQPEESPNKRIERAELLASNMPDPPRLTTGPSAWYRPSDDTVQVPSIERFVSSEAYYATLFHELGHATGNERRLNRKGVTSAIKFGSGVYSHEELVAELASAFCCATIGLDNSRLDDSASYIQGWLNVLKGDSKTVVIAAAQAQRAADYIRGVHYVS